MYHNSEREKEAERAAEAARTILRAQLAGLDPHAFTSEHAAIGMILGTGWGDTMPPPLVEVGRVSLKKLPGFENLETLDGHARELVCWQERGRLVLCLRGRVHMNESPDDAVMARMVRLQVEMMIKLGVTQLILTCAAGSLFDDRYKPDDIVLISGFVAFGQEKMPAWAGEFCSPSRALAAEMRQVAHAQAGELPVRPDVRYVYFRGPHFEDEDDKENMARLGGDVVGMSVKPECFVAVLYGVPVLAMGFVTNTSSETPDHEEHLRRARLQAERLGAYLRRILAHLP